MRKTLSKKPPKKATATSRIRKTARATVKKKDVRSAKKTSTTKKRVKRVKRIQIQIIAPNSYNEMLVKGIGSKSDRKETSPYSLLMYSLMMNGSQMARTEAYRTGISVGKMVYDLNKNAKDKTLGDTMRHIVNFFESAGHRYTTYNIHPHQVVFQISNEDEMDLGLNTHVFESGILSGFISSVLHNHTNVYEEKCRHNGYKVCTFVSHTSPTLYNAVSDWVVRRFVDHIKTKRKTNVKGMSHMYSLLMMSMLEKREFSAYACSVMDMIGNELRTSNDQNLNKTGYILDGIKLLGIGTPSVRGNHITVRLTRTTSKMGIVKLVASMVGGLLDKHPINAEVSTRNGAYTIRFER